MILSHAESMKISWITEFTEFLHVTVLKRINTCESNMNAQPLTSIIFFVVYSISLIYYDIRISRIACCPQTYINMFVERCIYNGNEQQVNDRFHCFLMMWLQTAITESLSACMLISKLLNTYFLHGYRKTVAKTVLSCVILWMSLNLFGSRYAFSTHCNCQATIICIISELALYGSVALQPIKGLHGMKWFWSIGYLCLLVKIGVAVTHCPHFSFHNNSIT